MTERSFKLTTDLVRLEDFPPDSLIGMTIPGEVGGVARGDLFIVRTVVAKQPEEMSEIHVLSAGSQRTRVYLLRDLQATRPILVVSGIPAEARAVEVNAYYQDAQGALYQSRGGFWFRLVEAASGWSWERARLGIVPELRLRWSPSVRA